VTLANPQPDRTQRTPHATKAVAAILDLMADALRAPPVDITPPPAPKPDIIEGELVEMKP
jgi:hypothetical protein